MKELVGFIGLGRMGLGMARNLLKSGFPVIGFDVRKEATDEIRGLGGQAVGNPFEVAQKARVSILVVVNFGQIEEVVFGKQAMEEGFREGDTLIVSSTIAPWQVRNLGQRLEADGVQVLDAPISGGKEGAAAGTLSIMVGGKKENYERCLRILQAMGSNIYYLGALGNGLTMKLVNNLLMGVNNLAVAEGISLGRRAGLDPKLILEVIPKSTGDSWWFRNRASWMVNREFAGRGELDMMVKDLGYVLEMATSIKLPLVLSSLAREIYQMASNLGYGQENSSAIVKAVETMAGKAD